MTSFMNNIHKHLEFKLTEEENKTINHLGLYTHRNNNNLQLGIQRKPKQPNTTIHFTSKHPLQHKLFAHICYINRLLSTPITEQARQQEWNTICIIAVNSGFPLQLIHNLKNQIIETQHTTNTHMQTKKKKCLTLTYHSPLINKVTNLFKNTNSHIAFKTNNKIFDHLHHQSPHNKLNVSGIYRMQCKKKRSFLFVITVFDIIVQSLVKTIDNKEYTTLVSKRL